MLVEAPRVQALIALGREQWDAAAHALEEGLALARALPYPHAEARLLQVGERLYVQIGEPEAARQRQQAARDIFQRLGAARYAGG